MKKFKLFFLSLSFLCLGGLGLSFKAPVMALAEGEEEPEVAEVATGYVTIAEAEHGTVTANIETGNVGDICVLTVKHDLFYLIKSVSMNETTLVESETVSGEYKFALVAGENKIVAKFAIDEELCGSLTTIIQQATNQDWSNLFSVQNVITIVMFLLNGGSIIALVRYYIKDKKLEKKVEDTVKGIMEKIVPDATKETVVATVKDVIAPYFAKLQSDNVEVVKALSVYAKCIALSQENTPEARKAILDEISSLRIADLTTVESVKAYIDTQVADTLKQYEDVLAKLNNIAVKTEEILVTEKVPVEEAPKLTQEKEEKEEPVAEKSINPYE